MIGYCGMNCCLSSISSIFFFPFSFSMKEIDSRVVQEDPSPSVACSVKCEYDIMQHFQN